MPHRGQIPNERADGLHGLPLRSISSAKALNHLAIAVKILIRFPPGFLQEWKECPDPPQEGGP